MKLVLRLCAFSIALSSLVSTQEPALSSTKILTSEIIKTFDWKAVHSPRPRRQAAANAILEYWLDFDRRLPRLSPSERNWLMKEVDSAAGIERRSRALNTREYALWELELHLETCLSALRGLENSFEGSPDTEMFYWVKSINCYTKIDIQYYLKTASLSDGRHDGYFDTSLNGIILNFIVNTLAPSAMLDTMGWTYGDQ